VYEHHLVWWQHTGQVIKPGDVIHHKNNQKRDNRFENLEMKTNRDHSREHGRKRTAPSTNLDCSYCRTKFSIKGRNFRFKSRFQKNFYCSRRCFYRAISSSGKSTQPLTGRMCVRLARGTPNE